MSELRDRLGLNAQLVDENKRLTAEIARLRKDLGNWHKEAKQWKAKAQGCEQAKLTATLIERDRCARIAEQSNCSNDKGYAYGAGYADARAAIAAAIRGGKP